MALMPNSAIELPSFHADCHVAARPSRYHIPSFCPKHRNPKQKKCLKQNASEHPSS
ncbi:hypothetical protein CGCSCA5_v004635 [Colletotrichum siamense]|uniref:uncharacterized protein n=1 Tax=Colletotrichum siamense TaxID=690259 RepID=UPI0018726FE6|nr:uncharacterized protein CGCS363_v010676 [Colletotrichum siamense]KAF4819293.1 hypothetical protein CGCSCA5_v004635 [Colletotrichum siamense]KAF5492279.1 hypothetical protein CGCS363_v010676 [Colletotrichum siamense]